ncbi:hypothetical protein [Microbacterium capsulatum]|uniref:Uncharacterized protein n=1 Tax=Microbacterium capsulatum TaxID=3041921 RepID=A0ABU0XDW3_9MICO|nr:hypothetical protein [Microbacterium sp. ASV81]MDQ4213302.1 hypothetical protein [Microbacterium sp. ASV81]
MSLAQNLATWFIGLLPNTDSAHGLIVTAQNAFGPILAGAASIGAWMPWDTLAIVFPIVMLFYIGAFVVKVFRALFSHVPLFGGNG